MHHRYDQFDVDRVFAGVAAFVDASSAADSARHDTADADTLDELIEFEIVFRVDPDDS